MLDRITSAQNFKIRLRAETGREASFLSPPPNTTRENFGLELTRWILLLLLLFLGLSVTCFQPPFKNYNKCNIFWRLVMLIFLRISFFRILFSRNVVKGLIKLYVHIIALGKIFSFQISCESKVFSLRQKIFCAKLAKKILRADFWWDI